VDNAQSAPDQEFCSLEKAAELLYVSRSTVYRLLAQGKLRGMKAGKQWRFRRDDLLAYLQRGPAALALANLPIAVLDTALAALADDLAQVGTSTERSDDPTLVAEAGKISQLARRMVWLLRAHWASDLHLEPVWEAGEEFTRLRLRVNGELREIRRLPAVLHEPLVMEWKQRAGLSVEERSRPQDGTTRMTFGDTLVALRVSVVPTLYGERVAVRDIPTRVPTLDEMGIAGDSPLREWVRRPSGLLLITGPAGSGKATTRAACVREIDERGLNIMAAEGQVDYMFLPAGVAQLKVEQFSCAEGVRAILRQDPDVILVGDMRDDPELAQVSAAAAETGHLVLACLLAYDSIGPLYDLAELGVKRSILAGTVVGIVSQHLVRKLCEACKAEEAPDPDLLADIRRVAEEGGYRVPESPIFLSAPGCEECHATGHVGRIAVHEYFAFSPASKAAFVRGATADELSDLARQEGYVSAFAASVRKAAEGVTSLEEAMRRFPGWRG
jgi:general secretion pathway protein E